EFGFREREIVRRDVIAPKTNPEIIIGRTQWESNLGPGERATPSPCVYEVFETDPNEYINGGQDLRAG
ncbi:hypothetical protein GWI33_011775, partial [Rhynchophorus ferrugineus]